MFHESASGGPNLFSALVIEYLFCGISPLANLPKAGFQRVKI
jgi:hypothetical protein